MEIRKPQNHPGHAVEQVFAMYTDASYIETKYAEMGARKIQIDELAASDDGGFKIRTRREMPADVPGALKKFLGEWNKVIQTETWTAPAADGTRSCRIEVQLKGVPVTIKGTLTLRPEGSGSVNDVALDITCRIPLVGRKLADFVGKNAASSMDDEYAFDQRYLAK
jgi:hypothetical protein